MARAFPMAPSLSPRGAHENTFRWPARGDTRGVKRPGVPLFPPLLPM
jgi:hypothetical protein